LIIKGISKPKIVKNDTFARGLICGHTTHNLSKSKAEQQKQSTALFAVQNENTILQGTHKFQTLGLS